MQGAGVIVRAHGDASLGQGYVHLTSNYIRSMRHDTQSQHWAMQQSSVGVDKDEDEDKKVKVNGKGVQYV